MLDTSHTLSPNCDNKKTHAQTYSNIVLRHVFFSTATIFLLKTTFSSFLMKVFLALFLFPFLLAFYFMKL